LSRFLPGRLTLSIFGLTLGLGVARYTEPDKTMTPEGARLPVPVETPQMPGPVAAMDPSKPIPPEVFRGMLDAAHQSLEAGQYQQAIAAYQAVLKRDPKNVEAITHLGVILATAGHDDSALEAFNKALALDPKYAHAWWDKGPPALREKAGLQGGDPGPGEVRRPHPERRGPRPRPQDDPGRQRASRQVQTIGAP